MARLVAPWQVLIATGELDCPDGAAWQLELLRRVRFQPPQPVNEVMLPEELGAQGRAYFREEPNERERR